MTSKRMFYKIQGFSPVPAFIQKVQDNISLFKSHEIDYLENNSRHSVAPNKMRKEKLDELKEKIEKEQQKDWTKKNEWTKEWTDEKPGMFEEYFGGMFNEDRELDMLDKVLKKWNDEGL